MHIFSVRRIKMFVKEMRPQYLDSDNRMPICCPEAVSFHFVRTAPRKAPGYEAGAPPRAPDATFAKIRCLFNYI
jgi:hypothetical protein